MFLENFAPDQNYHEQDYSDQNWLDNDWICPSTCRVNFSGEKAGGGTPFWQRQFGDYFFIFILELGNVSDFWGRNMKTFPGKSSQRPLIRSGSEWPPYLGLGPTKAFPGGGTAAAPTVPWAPHLKLDANFTDKFMAHRHGYWNGFLCPLIPVIDVKISATNGCFFDANQYFSAINGWNRNFSFP